eukprot:TRINITY_DN29504_c0_g1_i1.p1 TRINITY_DN29504_c0_g1~~TRINITY_DN29504_c0_g1_i1.p1  ORF type:complete len:807 (-),score=106.49 TRINITY_DN29504_c0_g1_i1:243-2663(-)
MTSGAWQGGSGAASKFKVEEEDKHGKMGIKFEQFQNRQNEWLASITLNGNAKPQTRMQQGAEKSDQLLYSELRDNFQNVEAELRKHRLDNLEGRTFFESLMRKREVKRTGELRPIIPREWADDASWQLCAMQFLLFLLDKPSSLVKYIVAWREAHPDQPSEVFDDLTKYWTEYLCFCLRRDVHTGVTALVDSFSSRDLGGTWKCNFSMPSGVFEDYAVFAQKKTEPDGSVMTAFRTMHSMIAGGFSRQVGLKARQHWSTPIQWSRVVHTLQRSATDISATYSCPEVQGIVSGLFERIVWRYTITCGLKALLLIATFRAAFLLQHGRELESWILYVMCVATLEAAWHEWEEVVVSIRALLRQGYDSVRYADYHSLYPHVLVRKLDSFVRKHSVIQIDALCHAEEMQQKAKEDSMQASKTRCSPPKLPSVSDLQNATMQRISNMGCCGRICTGLACLVSALVFLIVLIIACILSFVYYVLVFAIWFVQFNLFDVSLLALDLFILNFLVSYSGESLTAFQRGALVVWNVGHAMDTVYALCVFEDFGKHILPMVQAAKDAVPLILLLGFFIAIMCNGLYLLDTRDAPGGRIGKIYGAFLPTVRLALFGDFDLFEAEGLDPIFRQSDEGAWEPEDPTPSKKYEVVHMWFYLTGIVGHLLLANLLIGVLGSSYEKFEAMSAELLCGVRVDAICRYRVDTWRPPCRGPTERFEMPVTMLTPAARENAPETTADDNSELLEQLRAMMSTAAEDAALREQLREMMSTAAEDSALREELRDTMKDIQQVQQQIRFDQEQLRSNPEAMRAALTTKST